MKMNVGALSTLVLVIVLSPAVFSQRSQPDQLASGSVEAKASPAIAWSEMQTPQPLPSALQSLTGTVVKMGDKYVLRTMNNATYQLDDQDKAREFEGKRVQVIEYPDLANNLNIRRVEAVPSDH